MNITIKPIWLVLLCIVCAAVGAELHAAWVGFRRFSASGVRLQRETPAFRRFAGAQGALSKSGRSAEQSGDFAEAESDYRAEVKADPANPDRLRLAELEEKAGDHAAALADLKWLMHPPKNVSTSFSIDPLALTQYADLSMLYGSKEEGREFYYRAAQLPISAIDEYKLSLTPITKNSPLPELRSRAYAGAGSSVVSPLAINYAELAVSLAPKDPLPRVVYAEALRYKSMVGSHKDLRDAAKAQMWEAEQLATGASKDLIKKGRLVLFGHYGKSTDHVDINNGKVTMWSARETPDRPSGPVPTPHPIDPITATTGP